MDTENGEEKSSQTHLHYSDTHSVSLLGATFCEFKHIWGKFPVVIFIRVPIIVGKLTFKWHPFSQ